VERWRMPAFRSLQAEVERMFLSQFKHNLDEKGRLTVPAKYRDTLVQDGAYLMLGLDQNLLLVTAPDFQTMSQSLNEMNLADVNARTLRRLIFSTAERADLDRAGRILISPFLRELAGIQDEVIVVGSGDVIELWSPERWLEQMAQLQDVQANNERFAALNIRLR
jgi:MraZ protein